MSVAAAPALQATYAQELPELVLPWEAAPAPAPQLLALNPELAVELGLDPAWLASDEGLGLLTGATPPPGSTPVAQAYAGHQFGGWVPRLGDGRALLLGELVDPAGHRHDLHLKGSGRTPFARGGDGKAAVGPMLREWVVGEAMHALGIPTTRALAVVATGEAIQREVVLPGAVLTRVASSHLRVGTFQYARQLEDPAVLKRLADHAIARHHPAAAEAELPYLALLEAVIARQAELVARWLLVGFVHGVMNTDNVTISGETIDYGPCAFMEAYDPETVFSSIDQGGRYAYANQPQLMQWDLTRLAEALLPLLGEDTEHGVRLATASLQQFQPRFERAYTAGMARKLGLQGEPGDLETDLLRLMQEGQVDWTSAFRVLSSCVEADAPEALALFAWDQPAFTAWADRWRTQLRAEGADPAATAAAMDAVNPLYVPRNALVEDALSAATAGDLAPVHALVEAVSRPFEERPGLEACTRPSRPDDGPYRTFCGT